MIPKASQRGGGQQLATHLLNEFDNDRVEIAEVRGAIAPDLHGAFAEWSAVATGTNCRKYLYSLSVNPDPEQGPLTRDQYRDFINRTEKKLGLEGQPRALVFHVKHGREHCHCVWSRIDTDKMQAVHLSHDRHSLRSVVIDFARAHRLELPRGMVRDRERDQEPRRRPENLAEEQQEERTGITKAERMALVAYAWRAAPTAESFVATLKKEGYVLAAGDKRTHVLVDAFGEIHSLSRQLRGIKAKDIRQRLGKAFAPENPPDAAKLQARIRKRLAARFDAAAHATAQDRRDALAARQKERRTDLDQRRQALSAQHRLERIALVKAQRAETHRATARRDRASSGMLAFLTRITGIKFVVGLYHKRQDRLRADGHRDQRRALVRRHGRELQDFAHHERALVAVDKRERRSLETLLRREQWRMSAMPPGVYTTAPAPEKPLKPEWQRVAAPAAPAQQTALPTGRGLTAPFAKAAAGAPAKAPEPRDRLAEIRDAGRDLTTPARAPEEKPETKLKDSFRDAADERARKVLEELRRRDPHREPPRTPGRGRGR